MTTERPPALSGPLHIDRIAPGLPTAPAALIGMTHCPGRNGTDGRGRVWQRDLAQDVAAIQAYVASRNRRTDGTGPAPARAPN